jgi:hypothetical protein
LTVHKALKRRIEELESINSELERKLDRAMRLVERAIEQKTASIAEQQVCEQEESID